MALTAAQQAQLLFKASQGKSSTNVARDFFEEPRDGKPVVYPTNIWSEFAKIPLTAPGGTDAQTTGVVTRFIDKVLTAVPGVPNSFFHADLVDCVPFNTGDGSYNYGLKDSSGNAIPFGLGDWIVDPNTGTLTFYSTVPANMPPRISFYKYVGLKGTSPARYTTAEINAIAAPVTGQMAYDTTLNQYKYYNGTAWTAIGAGGGSGQGAVNSFTNPKFETGTTGWDRYKDVAQSLPTTALGGTPDSVDINTTTTNPIEGLQSGLFTKGSGLSALGEGIKTDFQIPLDDAFVGSMQFVSFSHTLNNGTLNLGDIVWGVIDLSLTAPNNVIYSQSLTSDIKQYAAFPLKSATRNYRFFMHVATNATTAVGRRIDNFNTGSVTQAALQGLITQPDSLIRIVGFPFVQGTTATRILSLAGGTIVENFGSDIQYSDDAQNGARFVALRDTPFTITVGFYVSGGSYGIGFSKNSQNLTTVWANLPASEKAGTIAAASNGICSGTFSGTLKQGDVIRIHNNDVGAFTNVAWSFCNVSTTGSTKSVTAIPGQKLTIPTSEVRFENSAGRGTTDLAVVRWGTIANLRGDAFEIISTAANGTTIKMRKAGNLHLQADLNSGANSVDCYFSRNQTNLNAAPPVGEKLAWSYATSSAQAVQNLPWNGAVRVGDLIRFVAPNGFTANANNSMTAFFWEDQINLALNTVQPQWSQSDTVLTLVGVAAGGTTNGQVCRLAGVALNQGTGLTFADDPALGSSITCTEPGLYFIGAQVRRVNLGAAMECPIYITRNTTSLNFVNGTYSVDSVNILGRSTILTNTQDTENASMGGPVYLNAGDVVRFLSAAPANASVSEVTIARVGKPNLTSVDVTPFITFPEQTDDVFVITGWTGLGPGGYVLFQTPRKTPTKGIIAWDTFNGATRVRALKKCSAFISSSLETSTQAGISPRICIFDSTNTLKIVHYMTAVNANSFANGGSMAIELDQGDYALILGVSASNTIYTNMSVIARAANDVVVSASKQVSSDTLPLAFKATAIDPNTDPIGTYNTYIYTANSNTFSLATTAPTQSLADMNLNGLLIVARPYTATSTAAQPTRFDIFIGKGIKATSVFGYGGIGRTNPVGTDFGPSRLTTNGTVGILQSYSETTGILSIIGTGILANGAPRSFEDAFGGTSSYTSAYFVFNASANPALLSVPTVNDNAIGASYFVTSGTAITANQPINFDTMDDDTVNVTTGTNAWRFPIRSPGRYVVEISIIPGAGTGYFYAYKTGVQGRALGYVGGGLAQMPGGSTVIKCTSINDYIDVRANFSGSVLAGSTISIYKLGN